MQPASSPKEVKMALLSEENGFANLSGKDQFLAQINLYERIVNFTMTTAFA
jgi:hypothetical protein